MTDKEIYQYMIKLVNIGLYSSEAAIVVSRNSGKDSKYCLMTYYSLLLQDGRK